MPDRIVAAILRQTGCHVLIVLAVQMWAVAAVDAREGGEPHGASQIAVSGDLELTLRGQGLYLLRQEAQGETFMLVLTAFVSETDFTTVEILGRDGVPGPGSYSIDGVEFQGGWLHSAAGETWIGAANSGELVIDSATPERLNGSLRFSGELVKGSDYENVMVTTVEATFEAQRISLDELPGAQ